MMGTTSGGENKTQGPVFITIGLPIQIRKIRQREFFYGERFGRRIENQTACLLISEAGNLLQSFAALPGPYQFHQGPLPLPPDHPIHRRVLKHDFRRSRNMGSPKDDRAMGFFFNRLGRLQYLPIKRREERGDPHQVRFLKGRFPGNGFKRSPEVIVVMEKGERALVRPGVVIFQIGQLFRAKQWSVFPGPDENL